MSMQKTMLQVSTYAGSLGACGRAYGEEHAEGINIGLDRDIRLKKSEWRHVEQCMAIRWKHKDALDELIGGVAAGSGRTFMEIARLFFEGYGSSRNCTAFAATRRGTTDGKPILGMNWDGPLSLYPWSRLLRFDAKGWPRMLVYSSRPGQPIGAGINEHGMSLVWTSAAPSIRRRFASPRLGVPTYCQVTGILACRDCAEAIALLKEAPNAAGFIFFLADARGSAWVVEAIPNKIDCIECKDAIGRANHLESAELIRISQQVVPRSTLPQNTAARGKRIHQLIRKHCGRINRSIAEAMLSDTVGKPGHTICRSWAYGDACMTIDSFYLLPAQRQFCIARGLPSRHTFECHRV
jgi:hypothetical protein